MRIVVTGSVAFDNIMSFPGRFKDQIMPDKIHILNINFSVDSLKRERGGTGGNQAYTLNLLGYKPKLVAAAGKDFGGYKKKLENLGLDVSGIMIDKNKLTATGFVVTDQDDNQIWSFYSGAMSNAKKIDLKQYVDSDSFVVISPNEVETMKKYIFECWDMKAKCLFDPAFAINYFSKEELKECILKSSILIGNDYEMELILRRSELSKKEMLKNLDLLITTLGAKGSLIETGKKKIKIPAAKPKNTSDPTGAGDAYRAGFTAGYLKGLDLEICGRMGALAAVYTVELYGTQTHKFTIDEFKRRYKENFKQNLMI